MLDVRTANAPGGSKGDIIDFRIATPGAAAGDSHFEFARKVVEVAIAAKSTVYCKGPGGCIEMLVVSQAGDGAAGNGANNVAA